MRVMLVLGLAAAALACGAGRTADAPVPSGLFRAGPADVQVEAVASQEIVTVIFHRTTSLDDLTGLQSCPDLSQAGTLPAALRGTYASWLEALAAASTSWGLSLSSGQAAITMAASWGPTYSCQLSSAQAATFTAGEIVLADGSRATFSWKTPSEELQIVARAGVAVAASDELPATGSGDYDWLFGRWAMPDAPGETIVIQQTPRHITEEHVRQVGDPNRSDIPLPTICHFRFESDAFRLVQDQDSALEVQYSPGSAAMVEDASNDPGCAAFVAEQQNRIAQGTANLAFSVQLAANDFLVVDGEFMYLRQ